MDMTLAAQLGIPPFWREINPKFEIRTEAAGRQFDNPKQL